MRRASSRRESREASNGIESVEVSMEARKRILPPTSHWLIMYEMCCHVVFWSRSSRRLVVCLVEGRWRIDGCYDRDRRLGRYRTDLGCGFPCLGPAGTKLYLGSGAVEESCDDLKPGTSEDLADKALSDRVSTFDRAANAVGNTWRSVCKFPRREGEECGG